jgi:hypothetical protein
LLAVTEYSAHHVNRCHRRIEADVAAFSKSNASGAARGQEIKLTEAEFRRLADRFLAEIESRY